MNPNIKNMAITDAYVVTLAAVNRTYVDHRRLLEETLRRISIK